MESADTFQTNVLLSCTIKHDNNCDIPSPSKRCLRAISCSALTKNPVKCWIQRSCTGVISEWKSSH